MNNGSSTSSTSPSCSGEFLLLEKTIKQFATLLGTFYVKSSGDNSDNESGSYTKETSTNKKRDYKSLQINSLALPCNKALSKLFAKTNEDSSTIMPSSSFPSLALKDDAHHEHHDNPSKDQIEEIGCSNMSRSIIVRMSNSNNNETTDETSDDYSHSTAFEAGEDGDTDTHKTFATTGNIANVPRIMLNNLKSSFALLLDARLRAYTTFLARHEADMCKNELDETEILAIKHKLDLLVDIGTHTSIDTTVTSFHMASKNNTKRDEDEEKVDDNNFIFYDPEEPTTMNLKLPVVMEAVMDVSIPNFEGGKDCITISLQASGTIKGSFEKDAVSSPLMQSPLLKSVRVELDTHELLSKMINRAGLVMKMVVEIVNKTCFNSIASTTCTDTAAAAVQGNHHAIEKEIMKEAREAQQEQEQHQEEEYEDHHTTYPPPPLKKLRRSSSAGALTALLASQHGLTTSNHGRDDTDAAPVVSPDLGAKTDSPIPTLLNLDNGNGCNDLTPERCATIVDCVIGAMNDDFFNNPHTILPLEMKSSK